MSVPFSDLLDRRFAELGVGPKDADRAAWLKVDKGTFSKIMSGRLALSEKRAKDWSSRLYSDDFEAAAEFAKKMYETGSARAYNINEFCDWIVKEGGVVSAESIAELFKAATSESVVNALLLIEYRDIPRAGPQAKYQSLASDLAAAVVDGLSIGMFMPFKLPASSSSDRTRSKAEKLMEEIRDECRVAYRKFFREAERLAPDRTPEDIRSRLKLYEPHQDQPPTLGTGFQAKTFYFQYDGVDGDRMIRHHRIFQWVATPTRDLLIYRGELMITPAAMRDSFFPVPHFCESDIASLGKLKSLPELPMDVEADPALEAIWQEFGLPVGRKLWQSYKHV